MEALLKTYIEQQFRAQGDDVEVALEDDLNMLGLDSIAYVRLVAFIEQEFDLVIPESHVTIDQFGSVASIAEYLRRRQDQGAAG